MRYLTFDRNNGAVLARSLREIDSLVQYYESYLEFCNTEAIDNCLSNEDVTVVLKMLRTTLNCAAKKRGRARRPHPRQRELRVIEGGKR